MTRAQISQLILSWLDDEKQGYFNANDVNMWINLAQRQVQMQLLQAGQNWYVIPVETQTVLGQGDYILPANFMSLNRLEIVLSGTGDQENRQPVSAFTLNQQDLSTVVNGTPTNFYMKKDRFTLMPTPSQAWVMRLYYSYRVQDLQNDSDVPDVPEQFMEYLALLACFDGFIKDDRAPDNLVQKRVTYENLLQQMKNDRTQDHPRMVVATHSYDSGSWF